MVALLWIETLPPAHCSQARECGISCYDVDKCMEIVLWDVTPWYNGAIDLEEHAASS
jgi:hypothetical protein